MVVIESIDKYKIIRNPSVLEAYKSADVGDKWEVVIDGDFIDYFDEYEAENFKTLAMHGKDILISINHSAHVLRGENE